MKRLVLGLSVLFALVIQVCAQDYILTYVKCVEDKGDFKYSWHWFDPGTKENGVLAEGIPSATAWDLEGKAVYCISDYKIYKNTWPRPGKQSEVIGEIPENASSQLSQHLWFDASAGTLMRDYCVPAVSTDTSVFAYTCCVDEYKGNRNWVNISKTRVEVSGGENGEGSEPKRVVRGLEEIDRQIEAGEARHKVEKLEGHDYGYLVNRMTVFPLPPEESAKVRELANVHFEFGLAYIPLDMSAEELTNTKGTVLQVSKRGVILAVDPGPEDAPEYTSPIILWNGSKFSPVEYGEGQLNIMLNDRYFFYYNKFLSGPVGFYDRQACRYVPVDDNAFDAAFVQKSK